MNPPTPASSETGGPGTVENEAGGRPFPFPVFENEPPIRGPVKRSPMGRRRALVLGGVHVAVLAHATHWLVTGRSLSPVEPSESMRTFELGEVNAGFVFFVLAILSVLVFGRFVCGWGCHIVALQDLCAWIMKRLGVRPRPFRSRLLLWAPLVLALYMFVWPTFKRLALLPLLQRVGPAAAGWFASPPPFPGFTNHLTTESFWATMPGWTVAVPFLLICGFATVYLLGGKAYCSYGCPYGGFFAPADRFALGRIRVDDSCRQCGHCTVSCTSNVRVHEEVREYGMVVDPGCMKCLDCVNVCPNGALSYGFGRPAVVAPPPRTGRFQRVYDLPAAVEVALGVAFLGTFLAVRGLYDAIPVLMSMGIAACTTYLLWLGTRLASSPDVSLQNLELRRSGRLRRAGLAAWLVIAATALFVIDSGFVRWHRGRAGTWDGRTEVPAAEVFRLDRPPLDDATEAAAARAAGHYRRADAIAHGGFALATTPEVVTRRAWLALVLDRPEEAAVHLSRLIARGGDVGPIRLDLARVLRLAGETEAAEAELEGIVARDPANPAAHFELASLREATGDLEGAVAELITLRNLVPEDPSLPFRVASLLDRLGRPREADRYRR